MARLTEQEKTALRKLAAAKPLPNPPPRPVPILEFLRFSRALNPLTHPTPAPTITGNHWKL